MVKFSLSTKKKKCCLRLLIKASANSTVVVKGYDAANDCMTYFRLEIDGFDHKGYLYCPMPLTPDAMSICIYTLDGSRVELIEKPQIVALKTTLIPEEFAGQKCMDLYRFVQNIAVMSYFCQPWHPNHPDKNLIVSKNNPNFCVKVSPQIEDVDDLGNVSISTTPARVARPDVDDEEDFIFIEISQDKRRKMSVYMCVAMLLHELGHYLLETDDEQEADKFARTIFFALGYPKSEYIYSFTDVFKAVKNYDGSINEEHDNALGDRLVVAYQDIASMEQRY